MIAQAATAATTGTLIALIGAMLALALGVGAAVWAYFRMNQGDPSEWRNNYLGEVQRREDIQAALHEKDEQLRNAQHTIQALKAATDLSGFEERMTARFEAFEHQTEQITTLLRGLVQAVSDLAGGPH